MADIYLEDLEARGLNGYEAAIVAAKEARRINEHRRHIEVPEENGEDEKPTSIALEKIAFGGGRCVYPEEQEEK